MKTTKLTVWVSDAERQTIKDHANAMGLSLSKYLGTLALQSPNPSAAELRSLYLYAGKAQTLAHLALERYSQSNTEPLLDDLSTLLEVTIAMQKIIQDLQP